MPCSTVKPVISSHTKRRPKISLQDRLLLHAGQKYCRMLQESILQYFQPPLSYHLSLRPLLRLFLSGRLGQVLPYLWLCCYMSLLSNSIIHSITMIMHFKLLYYNDVLHVRCITWKSWITDTDTHCVDYSIGYGSRIFPIMEWTKESNSGYELNNCMWFILDFLGPFINGVILKPASHCN